MLIVGVATNILHIGDMYLHFNQKTGRFVESEPSVRPTSRMIFAQAFTDANGRVTLTFDPAPVYHVHPGLDGRFDVALYDSLGKNWPVATFTGVAAKERAEEYAAWKNKQHQEFVPKP